MLKLYTVLQSRLTTLARDERGVTALEYGVIAAVMIVVGLASFMLIGDTLNDVFGNINTSLRERTP